MRLRNGYCFVGRSQAVIGGFEKGSAPVRKRRGEAAPVGLREARDKDRGLVSDAGA